MRLVPLSLLGAVSLAGAALLAAQSWPPVQAPVAPAGPAAPVAVVAPVAPVAPSSGAWWALDDTPPAPYSAADPADSLYRLAREAVSAGDYGRAAQLFRSISTQYPESDYAPDALYWEAYALFRIGGNENLQRARAVLDRQASLFPDIADDGDAPSLRARIEGTLAARGDAQAAEAVVRAANAAWPAPVAPPSPPAVPSPAAVPAPATAPSVWPTPTPPTPPTPPMAPMPAMAPLGGDDDVPPGCPPARDDERVVALNALLQMDSERALPLLERVLDRRDQCSATLRRRAVFLIAQKAGPQREELLLKSLRDDPDVEVRSQAVFWLSQTKSPRATEILEEVLRTSTDGRVRERALFALSNQDSPRAIQALRDFAARADAPAELRERSIFWLGQRRSTEDVAFLRELYGKLDDRQLKERILFSLAQTKGVGNDRWLMQLARDEKEPSELRGKALFWLSQGGLLSTTELGSLYDQLDGQEVKEQLIFALAQRPKDSAAVDRLMAIARSDADRKLRERAIFWLGQSKDPRVAGFLLELIDR